MLSLNACINALPLCFLSSTPRSFSTSEPTIACSSAMGATARIAVVGDVHDDWNLEEDSKALQLLQPDLVLFTGDFGNENVELVQSVAVLNLPKAVILGNHDSWKTQQFSSNLGEEHVAYKRLDFPTLKLSVVGGRPFSSGGDQLFRRSLLSARYGVQDMDGSVRRIYNAVLGTPEGHQVIFLAHNGPTGLGSNINDICGKDWVFGGGDHGDPDLAQAIRHVKDTTEASIPLVVFGHMHKELAYGNGLRQMVVVGSDKIIYLNGAVVPRVRRLTVEQGADSRSLKNNRSSVFLAESTGTLRVFTLVEILEGKVDRIAETWVSVIGDETALEEEYILFKNGN